MNYYDYEEDYEIDPEQLPDNEELNSYSPAPPGSYSPATDSTPITTAGINNEVEDSNSLGLDVRANEEDRSSGGTNFISVPLMIEEVQRDTAPLIFAGTSGDLSGFAEDSGEQKETSKRRAPHHFHPVFQGWNLAAETPQAKRQADWSQRIASARRNRVWRQFNLD